MKYGKLRLLDSDVKDCVEISKERCVEMKSTLSGMYPKRGLGSLITALQSRGRFAQHALYLSTDYDWHLGKDEVGELILVPTKKLPQW